VRTIKQLKSLTKIFYVVFFTVTIFFTLSLIDPAYSETAFQPATKPSNRGVQTKILNVSDFMMVPKTSWTANLESQSPSVRITEELLPLTDLGFRVIHLKSSVKGRSQASIDLADSGLIQTGDILLSFRPLWDKTLAYAHMQLGISHSGLVFLVSENGKQIVHTLESPIGYSSPLNAPQHYSDLDAIHVIRPNLTMEQKKNLSKWAKLILSNQDKFTFYSDYSKPLFSRGITGIDTPFAQIRHFAHVILGLTSSGFSSYCSEFVWSLLGLRNCDPEAYKDNCEKPIFNTENGALTGLIVHINDNAGLIQGPEVALGRAGIATIDKISILTKQVFVDVLSDPDELSGRMSEGHRAVAEANKEVMKVINREYYANGELAVVANNINSQIIDNFSPTSFLIRSNAGFDGMKYVGTIVFDQ